MASTSLPNIYNLVPVRLDGFNYLNGFVNLNQLFEVMTSWVSLTDFVKVYDQFLSTNSGNDTALNPEYTKYVKLDSFVLSRIISTLSETIFSFIYGLKTIHKVSTLLTNRFASGLSKACISHLRHTLHGLHQGDLSCIAYLTSAKAVTDQLATIGQLVNRSMLIINHLFKRQEWENNLPWKLSS